MKTLLILSTFLFLQVANAEGTWVSCTAAVLMSDTNGSPVSELEVDVFYVHANKSHGRQVGSTTFLYTASNKTFQLAIASSQGKTVMEAKLDELHKIEGENQSREELYLSDSIFRPFDSRDSKIRATLCKFHEQFPKGVGDSSLAQIRHMLNSGR